MYQLQNIDYLYRISTMTGSSKLVTVQADRDSHDLNDKHFVMLNLCRAIVNFASQQPRLNRFAGYRRGLRGNP
mgnify:CR=1 FL=1